MVTALILLILGYLGTVLIAWQSIAKRDYITYAALIFVVLGAAGAIWVTIDTSRTNAQIVTKSDKIAALSLELRTKADDQAESQKLLREKSDEIATLNRQIAGSQRILREKAEIQAETQRQLAVKSDENALLNSQMANLQRDLREKSEVQMESQILLRDKIEENTLLNSQMANLQREQNQAIHEIKSKIIHINDALVGQGILKAEAPQKSGQFEIQSLTLKSTLGTVKPSLSSTNITVLNGQIEHIFDSDLSISVKINSSGNKGRPFLHAMFVSPGKNIGKIDSDKTGYCTMYGKYSIKINSISSQSANLKISIADACSN